VQLAKTIGICVFLLCFGGGVLAGAPGVSLRPVARPVVVVVPVYYNARIRPVPRPGRVVTPVRADPVRIVTGGGGVVVSLRPVKRPANLRRVAAATSRQAAPVTATGRAGSVCGDRAIRGQKVAPVRGQLAACRIASPVRVTEIAGVALSQASLMDCKTAKALKTWIKRGAKPAVGRRGGGIKSLKIFAHYSCRTRNNQAGAKISEHARGKAIDIGAINLNDGSAITVLTGWNQGRDGRILKRMHRAACGPFGVVLGPDANRFHKDHFHFDTSKYTKPYCR
jgi:hypothetical protein